MVDVSDSETTARPPLCVSLILFIILIQLYSDATFFLSNKFAYKICRDEEETKKMADLQMLLIYISR